MPKRKPPALIEVRPDDLDLEVTQEAIEAQLAELQAGYERIKKQLEERRTLDAALRVLVGLSKRKPKVTVPVETKPRAKGKTRMPAESRRHAQGMLQPSMLAKKRKP